MEHTFFLKEPKSENKSLIIFSCYFKHEGKQFKYSTGEKISPQHWSFEGNRPKLKGTAKDPNSSTINGQLGRYSETFLNEESEAKRMNEVFSSQVLKIAFDQEFKKAATTKNIFFEAYDAFTEERIKRKDWKPATIKRYNNIKNHLLQFEKSKKYKLTFSKINEKFYTEFTDYCYSTLDHNTNTFSRNIGLFKTFMFWALDRKYTYNDLFKKFVKPERVITKEIALTLDQVKSIFDFTPKSKALERVKDIFVFQCLTGLRYGELSLINERTIENNKLIVKEEKDVTKEVREVPLFDITNYILKKYDYNLPVLSNQKQNQFIKEVFKDAKFTFDVEYSRTKNKEQETVIKAFNKRISTHTARRTFITIMRNKKIPDKLIMDMTGHKDIKTFNTYYKVNDNEKVNAVTEAFGSMELPKLKRA